MLELPGPHHITLWKSGFKEVQKKRTAEGHAPTPPGKGWKPQRPAEQAATERCWNRQKKIPHMKRQRRVRETAEGVQLRWNQIPYLPGGDAQTAEQLTTEVLPLLWRFWNPHQESQPAGPAKGPGTPRESDVAGQWALAAGLPRHWGRQRVHTGPRGEEQGHHRRLNQAYL